MRYVATAPEDDVDLTSRLQAAELVGPEAADAELVDMMRSIPLATPAVTGSAKPWSPVTNPSSGPVYAATGAPPTWPMS
jgi:hypothetical protein